MVIIKKTNDPMWKLDQMIDAIYNSKYGYIGSIMNDSIRSGIQEAYGINLNLFDTHRFLFSNHAGTVESKEYYFYEGPYEKIKAIFDTTKDEFINQANHICGEYPDGIILGFFATEFKDPEFRKSHMKEYADFVYYSALNYTISNNSLGAYSFYIDNLPLIYLFKRMENDEVPITSLQDISYKPYYSFDILDDLKKVDAIFENYKEFKKIVNTYNWACIYRFFSDHNAIDKDYQDEETTKGLLMKKLGIHEDDEESIKDDVVVEENNDGKESIKDDAVVEENNDGKDDYEFHVFLYNPFEDRIFINAALCFDMQTTNQCLERGHRCIYTTQTHFLSTKILKRGYRLFLHRTKDSVIEIKLGENNWTTRIIKPQHNLKNILLGDY